jgi:hypothetical protein
MYLKALPLTVIVLISLAAGSCKKETSDDLQKRADEFQAYLIGKSFIPKDFYSDIPIDYDQDDADPTPLTDLKEYILDYLDDDTIVFLANGKLDIDQGDILYPGGVNEPKFPDNPEWSIEIKKAANEVLFNYLEYKYQEQRYVLDHFNDTEILAHIMVTTGGQTAKLSTRFERIYP